MRRATTTTTTTTTNISFHSREIKLRDTLAARVSRGLSVGQRKNAWPRPSRKCSSSSPVAYEPIFLKFIVFQLLLLLRRMKSSSNRLVFQYYRAIVRVCDYKKTVLRCQSVRTYLPGIRTSAAFIMSHRSPTSVDTSSAHISIQSLLLQLLTKWLFTSQKRLSVDSSNTLSATLLLYYF